MKRTMTKYIGVCGMLSGVRVVNNIHIPAAHLNLIERRKEKVKFRRRVVYINTYTRYIYPHRMQTNDKNQLFIIITYIYT